MKQIGLATLAIILLVVLHTNVFPRFKETPKRAEYKPVIPTAQLTHHNMILSFHKKMDDNVPDGAIIFIGDSITEGLCVSAVAPLSVNYGIGGDTTSGVLRRLYVYGSMERASAVVLAIGVNDLIMQTNDEIFNNYRAIINRIPNTVPVVLNAILPLDAQSKPAWQGLNDRIQALNSRIEHLAKTDDRLFFVNAGPLLVDDSGNLIDKYHAGDGIHLNAKGYKIWIKVLKAGIQKTK